MSAQERNLNQGQEAARQGHEVIDAQGSPAAKPQTGVIHRVTSAMMKFGHASKDRAIKAAAGPKLPPVPRPEVTVEVIEDGEIAGAVKVTLVTYGWPDIVLKEKKTKTGEVVKENGQPVMTKMLRLAGRSQAFAVTEATEIDGRVVNERQTIEMPNPDDPDGEPLTFALTAIGYAYGKLDSDVNYQTAEDRATKAAERKKAQAARA